MFKPSKANAKAITYKPIVYKGKDPVKASTYAQLNSANLTKYATDTNIQQAAISREFEEYMSNTSHQREVADLQAAGLNPVLSANGGAQSYTSAQATAQVSDSSGAMASLLSTKYSSDASLQATREQAAAARYAADRNLEATKYATDRAADTADKDRDQSDKNSMRQTYGAFFGIIELMQKADAKVNNKQRKAVEDFIKKPNLKNKDFNKLDNKIYNKLRMTCLSIGVSPTKNNMYKTFKYLQTGNNKYLAGFKKTPKNFKRYKRK